MEITAYHEAGHVFMAIYLGARVRSVTIEPDRDDGPDRFGDAQVEWDLAHFTPREVYEKSVLVALAGPVAEMIHRGEPYHPGFVAEWAADWREAWEAAAGLVPDVASRRHDVCDGEWRGRSVRLPIPVTPPRTVGASWRDLGFRRVLFRGRSLPIVRQPLWQRPGRLRVLSW
jgi:hypothetical protein